jgi:hypothetical protein
MLVCELLKNFERNRGTTSFSKIIIRIAFFSLYSLMKNALRGTHSPISAIREESRKLAAKIGRSQESQTLESMARAWERAAEREARLLKQIEIRSGLNVSAPANRSRE